jgi:hypothetical protein
MCYMYGLGSGAIINISKGIRLLMNVVFGNDEQRRRIESIPLDEYRRDRSLHYHINESIIPFDAVAHLALLYFGGNVKFTTHQCTLSHTSSSLTSLSIH